MASDARKLKAVLGDCVYFYLALASAALQAKAEICLYTEKSHIYGYVRLCLCLAVGEAQTVKDSVISWRCGWLRGHLRCTSNWGELAISTIAFHLSNSSQFVIIRVK